MCSDKYCRKLIDYSTFKSPMRCQTGSMPLTAQIFTHWLSIYVKDMMQLPERHPEVYRDFMKEYLLVQHPPSTSFHSWQKMSYTSSQQVNGDICYLYDRPEAMALYMLSAPDSTREVLIRHDQSTIHHEETPAGQVAAILHERGNLFLDGSHELVIPGT